MLTNSALWKAIDALAKRKGMSPSGMARQAGLSPTLFNMSKRRDSKRERWPSTESIARVLDATGTSLEEFVSIVAISSSNAKGDQSEAYFSTLARLPLVGLCDLPKADNFDKDGIPCGNLWDRIALPGADDSRAFIIEVNAKGLEPLYREGDKLLVSPSQPVRHGDRIVLLTKHNELFIRKLGREGGQRLELLALNTDDPPITISRDQVLWKYRIIWASQ